MKTTRSQVFKKGNCFFTLLYRWHRIHFCILNWSWDRSQAGFPWWTLVHLKGSFWMDKAVNHVFATRGRNNTPFTSGKIDHPTNIGGVWKKNAKDRFPTTDRAAYTTANQLRRNENDIGFGVHWPCNPPLYSRGSVCFPASQMSSQRGLHSSPANRPHMESAWKINPKCANSRVLQPAAAMRSLNFGKR